MNRIKTRKAAKKELRIYTVMAFGFMLQGVMAIAMEFLFWYFIGTPTFLLVAMFAGGFALIALGLYTYDAVDERKDNVMWEKFDI